jgi:hypothetical protein
MIYFVFQPSVLAIKIGMCRSPHSFCNRLAGLQIGSADELKPLGFAEGGWKEEQSLHARFGHLRIRGEWFKDHSDLREYIRAHTTPAVPSPVPPVSPLPEHMLYPQDRLLKVGEGRVPVLLVKKKRRRKQRPKRVGAACIRRDAAKKQQGNIPKESLTNRDLVNVIVAAAPHLYELYSRFRGDSSSPHVVSLIQKMGGHLRELDALV